MIENDCTFFFALLYMHTHTQGRQSLGKSFFTLSLEDIILQWYSQATVFLVASQGCVVHTLHRQFTLNRFNMPHGELIFHTLNQTCVLHMRQEIAQLAYFGETIVRSMPSTHCYAALCFFSAKQPDAANKAKTRTC